MVAKALGRSRNTLMVFYFLSNGVIVSSAISCIACAAECFCRNPYWLGWNIYYVSKKLYSRLWVIFSSILEIVGSNDISLKLLESYLAFDLYIGMILAILN